MAEEYEREKDRGSGRRAGMEEIAGAARRLRNGIPERQVYRELGEHAKESHYRTLSLLMTQNLQKGNREIAELLKKNAAEAFEERKKRARILGEQAGTKLLFPMMLMLGVVLVILMVPAFFAFL